MQRRWTGTEGPLSPEIEAVGEAVLDAGFAVHSELGPGLLESIYAACLKEELEAAGLSVDREIPVEVVYRGKSIGKGLRLDMLVNDVVIVEVKSVSVIADVHEAQLLSYMRLSGRPLGFLFNFNVAHFRNGFRRKIWTYGN